MKRTVRVALLGALLQGSAQAGEQGATVKSSQDKSHDTVSAVQHKPASGKKTQTAHKRKPHKSAALGTKGQRDSVTEAPAETTVQVRGVRG